MMHNEESKKKNVLELSQKDIGQLAAVLLLGAFFIFAGGYFFGKKKMLEEFAAQQNNDCFADKVYSSFAAFSESEGAPASDEPSSEDVEEAESLEEVLPVAEEYNAEVLSEPQVVAYAQLCGFGTRRAAEAYQKRLEDRSIDSTHIEERKSRSKQGKMVSWYQVVTDPMPKDVLENLVEKIKKHDRLTGVKITELKAHGA